MGKVVRQVFTPKPAPYDEGSAVIDCMYIVENEARVEQARHLIEQANEYLFGQGNMSPNHDEIDRQRALLFEKPIEDLCTRIIDLPKGDWDDFVEYIGAITLEYQRRLNCASYFASSREHSEPVC